MTCVPTNPWEPVTSTLKRNPVHLWTLFKVRTFQTRPTVPTSRESPRVRTGELLVSYPRDQLLRPPGQDDRKRSRVVGEVQALDPLRVFELGHLPAVSLAAGIVVDLDDPPLPKAA